MRSNRSRFSYPAAVLLLAALPAGFAVHAGEAPKPVPDEKAQREALALIRELHAAEFKNAEGDAEAASALARKLRAQAAETNDDPAGRYVLTQEALRIFAKQGLVDELERLLHAQDDYFEIDLVSSAEALLKEALHAAEKAKKDDLKKRVEVRLADWRARRPAYQAAQAAHLKLKEKPEDPEACHVLGLYRCLDEGKWNEGLPLLKRSNAESERKLAEADLAAQGDAKQQAAAGDLWWTFAEDLGKTSRRQQAAQDRSAHWYRKAKASLAGLTKAKVEKRLADYEKSLLARRPEGEGGNDADREPAAHWTFDADSGARAADRGPNMLTLRLSGPFAWREGRVLGGLHLAGNAMGVVEDAPALNPGDRGLTVAAWIRGDYWYVDGGQGLRRIARKASPGKVQYEFWIEGRPDGAQLGWGIANAGKITGDTAIDQEWHHVAATWDRSEMALFLDGKELARKPAAGEYVDAGGQLTVGTDSLFVNRTKHQAGGLDDLRLYGRALAAAEVKALALMKLPFPAGINPLKRCAAAGEKINHQILAPGAQGKAELLEGPEGLKLGADGNLSWTPGDGDLGDRSVRIKYTLANRTFAYSMPVFVLPKALLEKLGGNAGEIVNAGPCALQGGKLLLVNPVWHTWDDAARWAKERGGTLACPHNAAENKAIQDLAQRISTPKETIHLGGDCRASRSTWVWADGKPFNFTNWARGEPNQNSPQENTIAMWIERGDWNDSVGEGLRPFVAEWVFEKK